MRFWRRKVCSDGVTAEFKGDNVPIGRKMPRTGVDDEGTSTSLEGAWLTVECSPKMATSVTRDSVDSWGGGGISAVAVISPRTSSMLIPAFGPPSPSAAVARIDE